MSLSKSEPRKYTRPEEGEVDDVLLPGRGPPRPRSRDVARHAPPPPDKARRELLAVLAVRGKPIKRKRGMVPSAAFRAVAGRYIYAHHYSFCVKFARSRSARHIPLDDLVQACVLGAYTALERFDADHPEAYRFLSYAKWYMLMETNRLLHRDEALVPAPQAVKEARAKLALTCPEDVSDEEAAEMLGMHVDDVRAARSAHLGHEHRAVDERSRVCRKSLADVRAAHDDRAAELRRAEGVDEALARLDPLLRGVLHREYGVGEPPPPGSPEPRTPAAHRALRHLALRRIREELEAD